jgi:hypothetical protein
VRVEAAAALAARTPEARAPLEILCAAVRDPRPTPARQAAIRHLAQLGPRAKDAAPALIALLQGQKIPTGVRNELTDALEALASIGPAGERVLEVLLARLPEDGGNYYHAFNNPVALALKKFGPTAVPALLRTFKEGKTDKERRCAVLALGYQGVGAKPAVPALEAARKRLREKDDKTTAERGMENTLQAALNDIHRALASADKSKGDGK